MTQTRLVDRKYVVSYTIDEDTFSSKGTLETLQEELEGLIKNWGKDTCYELDAEYSTIGLTLKGTRPATEEEIAEFEKSLKLEEELKEHKRLRQEEKERKQLEKLKKKYENV